MVRTKHEFLFDIFQTPGIAKATMRAMIKKEWGDVEVSTRNFYKKLADQDRLRYKTQMSAFNRSQQQEEQQASTNVSYQNPAMNQQIVNLQIPGMHPRFVWYGVAYNRE